MTPWVVLCLLAAPPDGAAKDQAKAFLVEGNALFDQGKLEPALALYEAAYRAYPSPKVLYNVATVKAALERHLDAATDFDRFLEETAAEGDSEQRRLARDQLKAIEAHLVVLEVRATKGAQVSLNDTDLGEAPISPIRLVPGTYALRARLDGHREVTRNVVGAADSRPVVALDLEPIGPPDPTPPVHANPAVVQTTAPTAAGAPAVYETWWFWAAVGVVAAGAITAGVVVGTRPGPFELESDLGPRSTMDLERL